MARRRKGNNPPAIVGPINHHPQCCCDRCLEADATKLEKRLSHQRRQFEQQQGGVKLRTNYRESPVVGPFRGADESNALYINAPMAICGTITPRGKKGK